MRLTHSLVQVAQALMAAPYDQHWGYDLSKRARVRSGVLYPILQRMLDEGWLADGWEDRAEGKGRRPRRRYYTLTDRGRSALGAVLVSAQSDPRFHGVLGWMGT
jgi:PadR family transcriptional regulator PadR